MKCAYLILAHKDPQQLARLLSMICVEGNSVYLHIDSKSDIASFKEYIAPYHSYVTLTPNRISINWGGFSMIKATLALIHTYLSSGEKADYVHLISGQDLPLIPDREIKNFFELNSSSNFIEWHPIPYNRWFNGGKDRFCYKWLTDDNSSDKNKQKMKTLEKKKLDELALIMPVIPEFETDAMIGGTGSVTASQVMDSINALWNQLTGSTSEKITTIVNNFSSNLNTTSIESFMESMPVAMNGLRSDLTSQAGEIMTKIIANIPSGAEGRCLLAFCTGTGGLLSGSLFTDADKNNMETQISSLFKPSLPQETIDGETYYVANGYLGGDFDLAIGECKVYFHQNGEVAKITDSVFP